MGLKVNLTLLPSPESNPDITSNISEVSQGLAGSIGCTQGEGFSTSINANVPLSNIRIVTAPPMAVDFRGDSAAGAAL